MYKLTASIALRSVTLCANTMNNIKVNCTLGVISKATSKTNIIVT